MEVPFLSPPAKRPVYNVTGMPETYHRYSVNGDAKRGRPKPPPSTIAVPPGQVSFRLLCHVSHIGGVIGKSGSIVRQFQQETGAKIRVEESVADCDERIIFIFGSETPKKKVTLKALNEEDKEGGEEREVSPVQEALVRVFQRILDVAAEAEEASPSSVGVVTCRLLAAGSQVGSVMGKGGRTIENIRKESGTKIKVLPPEQLPACAQKSDELIQITGDILGVKKAMIAVSRCLQDCPPVDKIQMVVTRSAETIPGGTFPDQRAELLPHGGSLILPVPSSSVDYASRSRLLSTEIDRISTLDVERTQQEVSFRILCSNDKVGGVIGKGGAIVRALQNETGASISVAAPVPESKERVITISAFENPESQFSPAQKAVVRVFSRSIEAGIEKGIEPSSGKGMSISARLLIQTNQVGCLMGKGGIIISEMRKMTSTGIWILGTDQVPKCASEHDQVVQITGEFGNVQDALFRIIGKLRDNLFTSRMLNGTTVGNYSSAVVQDINPYARGKEPTSSSLPQSMGIPCILDQQTALTQSMDHLELSHSSDHPPSPRLWASQTVTGGNPRVVTDIGRGLTNLRGLELGSGSKTAIVTNTTVEIVVPAHVLGSVYGENGNNLTRLRQISGAKVMVHDPHPGKNEGMVIISGTPDQTRAAQSLLQAFILSGQSSSDQSRLL